MEKIAVIDLGSNTVRMVLANILDGGHFVVFDELKETVRLGQDMDKDGILKAARIDQAIKTLRMFRKLCDAYKVDKIIAVGTNAVRRAKNQKSFLDEIYSVCGFKLNVLTQEEEAFRIYQGVINSLDIPKGLIIDISGTSTQLIHYNRRTILNFINLPFGSMTLTDLFADSASTPEAQSDQIEQFITRQYANIEWLKNVDPDIQLIGVGGAFRNLGRISRMLRRYSLDMAHNYVIPREEFVNIFDMIKVLDTDKRKKIKGMSSGRADILPSALCCIKGIFNTIPFAQLVISGSGLREGLMFNYAVPSTAEKPITDILGHSVATLMKYFDENQAHADHVYNLALQLFKQLRVLHKLPRQYVKILRIASMLHDTGVRVKFYDHHKHSFYVILNSNLYGATHRDLVLSAFVAGAHRSDGFMTAEWQKYKDLVFEEDLGAVRKLGVLLRIAESLDRSMSGGVKILTCDVLGDAVIMKAEVEGDCSLEVKDALSATAEFYRAFHKNLEIL
ncbi:MAG: Ppx/GppA family phosphatase [Firmicutes bacterium]|nr:Ppx/GppA family phosphatase [Bacillota bacterium]